MQNMKRSVMSPNRRSLRRRLPLALLPVTMVAAPVSAQQRDTVVARQVSTWQTDVDRLRQELMNQRRMELEMTRTLGSLQARFRRVPSDSSRNIEAQFQLAFSKREEAKAEQLRLRQQIETLCSTVQKPEGWLGVYTTGFTAIDRQGDGQKIVRFMEKPVVESVDPGSPADRVGLRAGDVLVEMGGKALLHNDIVFAELLRPGERVAVKVLRGRELVTVMPLVEPAPDALSASPCSWVDASITYVMAPMPGQEPTIVRVQPPAEAPRYAFSLPRRKDSSATPTTAPAPPSGVFAGPMAQFFSGGVNPVAGLQLVQLSQESSRAFGVTHGLLVNSVLPGTPGREAGLEGGDVILVADSVEVRSIGALQRVISRSRDRTVTLVVVRERKQENVTLRW